MRAHEHRGWWLICTLSGFFAVILGAYGTHRLSQKVSVENYTMFNTALRYQFWHTLALMAVLANWRERYLPSFTAICWALGVLLFSGSIYLNIMMSIHALSWLTPLGGLLMILGWFSLFIHCLAKPRFR